MPLYLTLISREAADISANLHNKVTKGNYTAVRMHKVLTEYVAVAIKILKELHERKEVEGRASGTISLCIVSV